MDELFLKAANQVISERKQRDVRNLAQAHGAGNPVVGAMQDGAGALVGAIGSLFSGGDEPGVLDEISQPSALPSSEDDVLAAQMGMVRNPETGEFDLPADAPVDTGAAQENAVGTAPLTGAAKAAFETYDFIKDDSWEGNKTKSGIRQDIEALSAANAETTPVAPIVEGIAQFTTGMLGVGKILGPIKAVQKVKNSGKVGKTLYEMFRGGSAGAIVLDPHEARLSNLIQQFPALENPVSAYLAANPSDTAAEGRLKNALEGVGMDVALVGTFGLALKVLRAARGGDQKLAKELAAELASPENVAAVTETTKPRVRVKAGSEVVAPGEKPRVRVKAGSTTEELPGKAVDDVATSAPVVDEAVPTEAAGLPAAKAAKTVSPQAITEPDMKAILDGTDWDLRAIDQAGSYADAVSQGHKFAPSGNLPWQKLNTTEEVDALIKNVTTTLRPELDKVKGGNILSDAQVDAQVRRYARYYNEEPSAVIGELVKAGKDATAMVRNMEAGYLVSNKMFLDSYQLINDIRWGNLDAFGGDAAVAMAEAKRRLELAVQVFGSSQSIRSNVGRTMRRMRSDFAVTPEDLAKIKSMDDEKFMSLILSTGGDPKKMKEMANPGFLRRALDEVSFSMRNGLLWNYPTHLINMTGNVLMQVARPLEKQIGSLVMGSRGSPIRQQATKEYYYTVASITDGLKAGLDAFMKGDSGLSPHTTEWLESSGSLATQHQRLGLPKFRPINDFADLWHNLYLSSLYRNVGGLPTRALGAQDEFFKTLRYRAVVQARAAMDAEKAGLQGQAFKDFMEDRLKRAFDANGRAVDKEALQEAQTVTFNQELLHGTLGAGLRNLRGQYPAMGLVVPFLKTPVNVLRYAHKYTPVLNLAQTEFRQMISGKMGAEPQAQAIGQMAIGSMFMAFSAMMAANGRFTGGGPSDPQLRQQLAATGWKPYSVKIQNEDGSTTFVPYGRLDPAGMVMSIAADLHHLYTVDPENRDIGDLATASAMALARNFGERSFLLNLNQLFGALSDPENRMEAYLGNMGAAMLPGSSAMRGYMNTDPYLRDARSLIDRALKDVPGYGDSLPPRRDAFGEPLTKKLGLTSTATLDLVEEEHNRMMVETGKGLSLPNPVRDGVDFRDITLPDGRNAYDVLQEFSGFLPSGPSLKEALEKLIKSDEYRNMADGDAGTKGTRLNALAGVVQKYRTSGYKRLMSTYPHLGRLALEKRANAAAEFLSNRTGDDGAGERLLKSLGY